jgi:hypothetical protein
MRPCTLQNPDKFMLVVISTRSEKDIYVRVKDIRYGAIYQLNSQDGSIVKRFQVGNKESGADVACVHDRLFLSFEHEDGRLIPLIGDAEPATEVPSYDGK